MSGQGSPATPGIADLDVIRTADAIAKHHAREEDRMTTDLVAIIQRELGSLYELGEKDKIAAARLVATVEAAGWRQITAERVQAAMEAVPNLAVEAYEPTLSEFVAALRSLTLTSNRVR